MKKVTAFLLAFCVLSISCQSTKKLSEESVAIKTPPATPVVTSVVKQAVAPVAKSATTHTVESVNERIDKNLEAKNSNDKTYAITDIQAGHLDSSDALIFTKITRGKNDNNDIALPLATSIDTTKITRADNNNDTALPLTTFIENTKIEKTLISASDTPEGTPTNGLVEPLTIVILSDADSDTQNEDTQPAVILASEQGHVLAFTAWVDTKNTLNMDYRGRTAVMLCPGASYRL